jgi:hypothetical protein
MAFIYIFVLTKEYWRDGGILSLVVDTKSKKKSMAFIY